MNILWITNIIFPEAESLLTGGCVFKSSGGWMIGAANAIEKNKDISLSIAVPCNRVSELKVLKGEKITYYLFPLGSGNIKYNSSYEIYFSRIKEMAKPDITHIHGTEFTHGLSYVRACGAENVVASIQGMVSEIWKYKTLGITKWEIIKSLTFSDIFLNQSLFHKTKISKICGKYEIELIKSLHHVIGRTAWDCANTWAINPKINYHFCNETLRPEFYSGRWSYENCVKHSIFFNQPTNSIKGFHQLLKALPLVLDMFPDTKIFISGIKGLKQISLKNKLLESGYVKYLRNRIKKSNLESHLFFLGPLSSEEMKREYLSANVFVSCSSIENSSNSIGEAQLLGTPCISSYVGGMSDMISHGETGFLYRFEDINTLAFYICKFFSGNVDLTQLSKNEIIVASARHNPDINSIRLINIYKDIIKE